LGKHGRNKKPSLPGIPNLVSIQDQQGELRKFGGKKSGYGAVSGQPYPGALSKESMDQGNHPGAMAESPIKRCEGYFD
jgi:hypothetical protein